MRTHASLTDLVRDAAGDSEIGNKLAKGLSEQAIVHFLFGLRSSRGVSQVEMAQKMECSQPKVSNLENGLDDELTIGELRKYLRSLDHDVMFVISRRNWTLVEQIKFHACMIRHGLKKMIALAKCDQTVRDGVSKFHVEAFYNLMRLVFDSAKNIPPQVQELPPILEADEDECEAGARDLEGAF